jgi:hypothetical protein
VIAVNPSMISENVLVIFSFLDPVREVSKAWEPLPGGTNRAGGAALAALDSDAPLNRLSGRK